MFMYYAFIALLLWWILSTLYCHGINAFTFFFLYENFDVFAYVYTAKTDWLFNRRVVTLVAEKLKKQWL